MAVAGVQVAGLPGGKASATGAASLMFLIVQWPFDSLQAHSIHGIAQYGVNVMGKISCDPPGECGYQHLCLG